MKTLSQLINAVRAGNTNAFADIVSQFQDMDVGYASAQLGDFHLAEDAAQEAFLQAYRDLSQLRDDILLFYISSYNRKDIASFLDVPVSTVDNRLRNGRQKLREKVNLATTRISLCKHRSPILRTISLHRSELTQERSTVPCLLGSTAISSPAYKKKPSVFRLKTFITWE